MKFKFIHFELLMYVLLSNIYINVVGSIALSEFYIIVMSPFILQRLSISTNKVLKTVTLLFAIYLTSQILSEIVIGNTFQNAIRGVMVTVVSYLTTMFLYDRFKKDNKLIVLFFAFMALKGILYINSLGLGENTVELYYGSNSFFKFKATPIITNIVLFVSYYFLISRKKLLLTGLVSVTILSYILFSARSASLGLFISLILLLTSKQLLKNKHRIIPGIIVITLFIYGGYISWVNYQLSGNLIIKNEQIERMKNPYNPFEMIVIGRAEFFVGIQAFSENFLWGNGTWTTGNYGKYIALLEKYQNNLSLSQHDNGLIPSHSVIIGAGVNNGIFAFLSMLFLLYYFFKLQMDSFRFMAKTPLAFIFYTTIIGLLWTSFFSPITHLRLTMPSIFAMTLIFYNQSQIKILKELSQKKNDNS